MRRSEGSRHPFFENVVFGLALLLLAILVFFGARSFLARRSRAAPYHPGDVAAGAGPGQTSGAGSATQVAVTAIPPIKLTSTGSARKWRVEVPSPTGPKNK